jgi:hypothetical protein
VADSGNRKVPDLTTARVSTKIYSFVSADMSSLRLESCMM